MQKPTLASKQMAHMTLPQIDEAPRKSSLQLSLIDHQVRPVVIVCPGGGYQHLAIAKEGLPTIDWLHTLGFHSGLLAYQVEDIQPEIFIQQLEHLMEELKQEPLIAAVYILGFSAGGHVAGLMATKLHLRPEGVLLCYPVVSFHQAFAHKGSCKAFMQQAADTAAYSIECCIDSQTPPMFLWHTAEDSSVPVENSLALAAALSKEKIAFELHIFPEGQHGLGLSASNPHTYQWKKLAEAWLKKNTAGENDDY